MTIVARPAPRLEIEPLKTHFIKAPFVDLGPLDQLTRRELEVLALLGEGLGLSDIADEFNRSIKTVKRFRDGIAQKLGIGDRTRLGMIARDLGLETAHVDLPRIEADPESANDLRSLVPRLTDRMRKPPPPDTNGE